MQHSMEMSTGEFTLTPTSTDGPAKKDGPSLPKRQFALDFDETFNRDPLFWSEFVSLASSHGIAVDIVTMRHSEVDKLSQHWMNVLEGAGIRGVVYAGAAEVVTPPVSKFDTVKGLGLKYDVWIDDNPRGIVIGSEYTTEQLEEWRKNDKHRETPYRPQGT